MMTIKEINDNKPKNSRWTVNKIINGGKYRHVEATCVCGNKRSVLVRDILHGDSISCGCLRSDNNKSRSHTIEEINLIKPKESRWTALEFNGYSKNGKQKKIKVQCICGTIKSIISSSLINGSSVSCGCYKAECTQNTRITIEEINKQKPKNSRLTAIEYIGKIVNRKGKSRIKVKCECGEIFETSAPDFRNGKSLSCGCYNIDRIKERFTKYYPVIQSLRSAYGNMISRCYDPSNSHYNSYGGRGVKVCDEWKDNYQNYLNWCLANGWRKGLEVDKDKKGNGLLYSPETCSILTKKENGSFKRNSIFFIYNGEKMNLKSICELENVSYGVILKRIKKDGMTLIDALNKPIRKRNNGKN
jgi:hypothetical protein